MSLNINVIITTKLDLFSAYGVNDVSISDHSLKQHTSTVITVVSITRFNMEDCRSDLHASLLYRSSLAVDH